MTTIEIIEEYSTGASLYDITFRIGEIITSDEYDCIDSDGYFHVCTGYGIYHSIPPEYFKIIES